MSKLPNPQSPTTIAHATTLKYRKFLNINRNKFIECVITSVNRFKVLLEYKDYQMLKKNNKKNLMFFVYVENAFIRCSFELSWKVFYLRLYVL